MDVVVRWRDRVRIDTLLPRVSWRSTRNPASYAREMAPLLEDSAAEAMQSMEGVQERS